ncbi:peptidoglycan/LPS O-acetylase OafA/YrhL [Pseudomonas nitritireducens]|uniref:Peptidoglycan/LPS O-acetylase OafA/YrhL n=1 Tax=Pseudomonas nitroreducens TaxID=46680 RepID=A0A7W7P024_PSENT|nr:acyltransferase [Pseudomonas nitritireducens]MBB4863363.1 peptidoglycan/LPS O-acetylase OafA/YrhL [Pseudomonas nitritireducens]
MDMKLRQLTSLRFFAAFGVFLCHFFQGTKETSSYLVDVVRVFTLEGAAFVGFFYILSGFIISYSYNPDSKPFNKLGFLYKRFARIYPVHILLLVVFATLFVGGFEYVDKFHFLLNATLLQAWHPEMSVFWGFNAVSWSLSCEVFFYLAFMFLVFFSTRAIVWMIVLYLVVLAVLQLVYLDVTQYWVFDVNPAARLIDFLIGILIFRIYDANSAAWLNWRTASCLEVGSVIFIVASMVAAIKLNIPQNLRFDLFYLAPMTFCVFVFAYGRGVISRILSGKVFVYLGEASFCLYMVHLMFLGYVTGRYFSYDINDPASVAAQLALMVVLVLGISCVLHSAYEKPANSLLLKAWGRFRSSPAKLSATNN